MYSIKNIDARIAEIVEQIKVKNAIETRVLDAVAKHYESKIREPVPESPPKEMVAMMEESSNLLQLHDNEIKIFDDQLRASVLFNPCYLPAHSPLGRCSFTAAYFLCLPWKMGVASATCTCAKGYRANELNPMAWAMGYGTERSPAKSAAIMNCYAVFEIAPAYPTASFVTVNPHVMFDGFYVLNNGHVKLEASAKGYQYGYNWGGYSETPINISGTTMNRFDQTRDLNFQMPVGADPFHVVVNIKLTAEAIGPNTFAKIDFATGAGNRIVIIYVNTWA